MSEKEIQADKPTTPSAAKAAKKTVASTSIRNQPTEVEVDKMRKERPKGPEVKVKTASGGNMWDSDSGKWIRGEPTLAPETPWLQRQIKARKVERLK